MNHHEATVTIELTPESRALEGCHGTPIVLSDGREWMLHPGGLLNGMDDLRDELDDSSRISGRVDMIHVREAAYRLLTANYELSVEEAVGLIRGADQDGLVHSVMEALFGPEDPRHTFTTWAAASLLANGIDPEKVPTPLLTQVLEILTVTGRTIPLEKYIDSAVAARKRAGFRAMAAAQAASRQADSATPHPPPVVISGPGSTTPVGVES